MDPDGGSAPRPPYRLALRARHVPPTFKLLPPPLDGALRMKMFVEQTGFQVTLEGVNFHGIEV